jgi:hypothetical protein
LVKGQPRFFRQKVKLIHYPAVGRLPYLEDFDSVVRADLTLTAQHWHCLDALLTVADFWTIPEQREPGNPDRPFCYVLEAAVRGHQRRVTRTNLYPARDGELFMPLVQFIEGLGQLALPGYSVLEPGPPHKARN